MGLTYIPPSERVVYLGRSGIVADGVTDQSAKLQAILDLAQAGPLRVVHDLIGTIVADGLLIWPGTTIETLRGCKWKKKGYGGVVAGLGRPLFQNKHIVAGGTNPTDADIHIVGGYWDGNRRGFASGGTTTYWAGKGDAGQAAIANNSDQVVPLLGFYGVTGCSVRDVDFFDLTSYGVHFGNVQDAVVEDLTKAIAVGDTFPGDNAVQLEGYCSGIRIAGVRGSSNDDLVALNANDGLDIYPASSPTTFQPGIVSGPIRDVVVRDVAHTGGAGTLLRLLNGNTTISNVLIEGFRVESTSTSTQACIYFNNIGIVGSPVFENITIRDVRGVSPSATGLVSIDATNSTAVINNLIIDGVSATGGGKAPVNVASGTINQFVLSNVESRGNPYLLDVSGGSVVDLHRGAYSASGLTADIHDPGSRIATIRRSDGSGGGGITESQVSGLTADLAGKALDSAVVHNTGAETIAGAKTFSTTIAGSVSGNAATVTTNANLTGVVTSTGNATGIANGAITAAMLASTAVTPGSYTSSNITVDAQGRITAAAAGAGGGVTGSGTTGSLAKWTGTGAVGNATAGTDYAAVDGSGFLKLGTSTVLSNFGTNNIFAGASAGNTSMTGTNNVATGFQALQSLTSGASNVAIGSTALRANTTGNNNVAIGAGALVSNTDGGANMAIGQGALSSCTVGTNNCAVGVNSLLALGVGGFNVGIGRSTLQSLTSGVNNVGIGYNAGQTATGGNALLTASQCTYLGYNAGPGSATQNDYSTAIGAGALTYAANTAWIGGTGATFGVDLYTAKSVRFSDQSSTGTVRQKGYLRTAFVVNTDASFTASATLGATDFAGDRDGVKVQSDGTQALVGFYGHTPVAKAAAPTTLADVIALLQALGLCS